MKKLLDVMKDHIFKYSGVYIFAICLLVCVLCGCALQDRGVPGQSDEEPAEDFIVVGFSQLGSESVWRTAHTASIQEALTKEKGYFLLYSNARQKQENQIKEIRSYISQRVDYIVFSPVTQDGWETVLQEAKDAGIPVILVDRMVNVSDPSLYTTWIGMDAVEEGREAGIWLETYLQKENRSEESINIVVLEGTPGSSAQAGRTMGFAEIAAKHSNWNILEQTNGEFTTTKGKEVMLSMLRKYDDIDVIVSQNDDMTFGVIEALQEQGISYGVSGDTAIISHDAVYGALEMVKEGKINVDIECNPLQGQYVAEVIQMLERGETVEKRYVVEGDVFTQENVEAVLGDRKY